MKKFTIGFIITMLCLPMLSFAQPSGDPAKAYRKANTMLVRFNNNPERNANSLDEAKEYIDYAIAGIDKIVPKKQVQAYLNKGNVYIALSKSINHKAKYPKAIDEAYDAYQKALNHEMVKKGHKATISKNLGDVTRAFWDKGRAEYQGADYVASYHSFNNGLKARDLAVSLNGDNDPLKGLNVEAGTLIYHDYLSNTAFLALQAKEYESAAKLYEKLKAEAPESPQIYDGLFKAYSEIDADKAFGFLEEGRKKYPNSESLLYSEINYFLKKGEKEKLESRLQEAIKKNPDNKSLYSVLGNTYDNMLQEKVKSLKGLNEDKEANKDAIAKTEGEMDELFGKAEKYYLQALEKDANYFDVLYSIGALYFNKAVRFVNARNQVPINDQKNFKKYDDQFKAEITKAHPYFVKAEKIKASDLATVIALKECYALASKFVHSNAFKKRLEQIKADSATKLEPYGEHPESLF